MFLISILNALWNQEKKKKGKEEKKNRNSIRTTMVRRTDVKAAVKSYRICHVFIEKKRGKGEEGTRDEPVASVDPASTKYAVIA